MNQPKIFPLDSEGTIYAIQDEQGRTIGTGTREVCEVLLYLIKKSSSSKANAPILRRQNIVAAIQF